MMSYNRQLSENLKGLSDEMKKILLEQEAKGVIKYGQALTPSHSLTPNELVEHAKQELADLMVYLTAYYHLTQDDSLTQQIGKDVSLFVTNLPTFFHVLEQGAIQ